MSQEAELKLAEQVISSLAGEWTPEDFENDYREDLAQMLESKLAGQEIVAPEPVAETPVIDLMEALRQSVADAQSRRQGSKNGKAASKGGSRSRKAPARKVRLTPRVSSSAAAASPPSACSCAWKRYLSIFP